MTLSLPYNLVNGTTADAAQVDANFQTIVDYVNALAIPSIPVPIADGGTGATTTKGAVTRLGLANKTVIPCTATVAGTIISLTEAADAPTVTAYGLGVTLSFLAPGNIIGPMTIRIGALPDLVLFNTPIFIPTPSVSLNQLLFVSYSPALNGWVLINTPPGSTSGFLLAANNLSDVASSVAALTNLGAASLAAFTTEQTIGVSGSQPLAGGLILKWGTAVLPASGSNVSQVAVAFGTAFPNNCFMVTGSATRQANSSAGGFPTATVQSVSPTGFQATGDTLGYTTFNQTVNFYWFAIGN